MITQNYTVIEAKMKLWRGGIGNLPNEYIKYHEELARQEMPNLIKNGIKIHAESMISDGWGDGMRVLQLIVELKDGTLKKLKWHDSNSKGCFFETHKEGGSSPFEYAC